MLDFSGKAALITGASRGIGRATALCLAGAGADVAINFKSSVEEARSAALEIEALGRRCIVAQGDVSVPADVDRVVQMTMESFGKVDILVNNAGFHRDTLLVRMSIEDWDEVMATNLRGAFLCTKAVLRFMLKQRGGRIVNIGSLSGLAGNAGQANYAAAKAGLIGFTKSVAREMGPRGITANLVAAGLVSTKLTSTVSQEIVDKALSLVSVGRLGTPEDIASAAVFLASDHASYITGQGVGGRWWPKLRIVGQ